MLSSFTLRLSFFACALAFLYSQVALADRYSDYYFSAKRNIRPDLFQQADYKKDTFGSPFLFPDHYVTGLALVGISSYGENAPYNQHEPTYYDNSTVPTWVVDLTDLALQVSHWKKALRTKNITTSVWREELIAYENIQLERVRSGKRLDPLASFRLFENDYKSPLIDDVFYSVEEDTCDRQRTAAQLTVEMYTCKPLIFAAKQRQLLDELAQYHRLSPAEDAFYGMAVSAHNYVRSINRQGVVFLVWQPTCECGNGFFEILVDVPKPNEGVLIASEFSYLVCIERQQRTVDMLNDCYGTHQLGTGQKIYLSGDYRYQLISNSGEPPAQIRAIRLRGEDIDGRTLQFLTSGHRVVE